jgi:predicted transcriptional regulator
MARQKTSRPTDAELAILAVLWRKPGISIRAVSVELKKRKPTTYATTQTLVRIMEKKGQVRRGEERYPALYYPTATEAASKKLLVRDFRRARVRRIHQADGGQRGDDGGWGRRRRRGRRGGQEGAAGQWAEVLRLVEQIPD